MRIKSLLVSVFVVLSLSSAWAQEQTIDRGVVWLRGSQDSNGSWSSTLVTPFEATCVVADTLNCLGTANVAYSNAISWIGTQTVVSLRYLSQKTKSLAEYGSDTTEFVGTLIAFQNEDGGFGISKGYGSDVLDTLLALSALKSANYSDTTVIEGILWYLLSNQNTDGGFGLAGKLSLADESTKQSNVYITSLALLTLIQYRKDYYLEEAITKASDWLITQAPESLWEKALMYSAIMRQDILEYILVNQQANGSWDNDAYATALCLRAIKDSMPQEAFLDLEAKYITYTLKTPSAGDLLTLKASVFNSGDTEIEGAEVQFYDGTSTIGPMLYLLRLAAKEYATVTTGLSLSSGTHSISAVIDPRNIIPEKNETNNTLSTLLFVSEAVVSPPDLMIISLSSSNLTPVRGEDILISARIKNRGEGTATNVLVCFLSNGRQIGDDFIFGSLTKNQETVAEIRVSFDTGTHNITVAVDPYNTISEQDEANNYATITIFATEVRELPDIFIKEITYQPPIPSATDTVEFKIIIQNLGKGDCRNPGLEILINNLLSESFIIPQLLPLGSFTLILTTNLNAGTNTLMIIADPYSEIAELNELNNTASLVVYILPAILPPPDLAVIELYSSSATLTTTDLATLTATIKNIGSTTAYHPTAIWRVCETQGWHNLTTTFALSDLPPSSTLVCHLLSSIPWEGTINVVLSIDPENSIEEQDETNNIGTTTVIVYPPVVGLADLEPALKITPVSPKAGESGTITLTLVNKGESTAYNFIASLLLQGKGINMSREFCIESLLPFSTYTISLPYNLYAGSYTLLCEVDIHHTVLEENETNNVAELQFIVSPQPPSALPDLTIKTEDITISPVLPTTAQTITITAIIKNIGDTEAKDISVRLYDGEPKWKKKLGETTIGSITQGGTASVWYETLLSPGTHSLYLLIDEGNIIAEQNETNNSASKTVYIQEGPPDLIITNILFSPIYPTDKDTIKITIDLLNQGDEPCKNIFIKVLLDSEEIKELAIPQLNGSETKFLYFTTGPISEGSYTFTIIADPDNLIQEQDETNNTLTTTLMVRTYLRQPPKVITVPWVSGNLTTPHDAIIGSTTTLKGTAHDPDGDQTMLFYKWEFGDGIESDWIELQDPYILEATHIYTGEMADGTPYSPGKYFTAYLYVKDQDSLIARDTYFIAIREKTQDVEVNMAIDNMLWWLHKTQSRYTSDEIDYGYWPGINVSWTAASVEAFELMGHLPEGDSSEDPYIETTQRGLNYLFNNFYTYSISQDSTYCPFGNPDVNGNGIGLVCWDYREIYDTGMALMAISSSGAPNRIALTGSPNVKGRTYKEIAQDMVDCLAWGQTDPYAGGYEGGWRYSLNYGQSDNSVSQWPVIGMESAERNFGESGLKVPEFVRPELLKWLSYSQNANGGFGYDSPDNWLNTAKTGAGCAMLSWCGIPESDDRFQRAISFLNNDWYNADSSYTNFGDYYAMYAIMKGMRLPNPDIEMIGTHSWYSEYSRFIIDELNKQEGGYVLDTSWMAGYINPTLATAWAVAILVQTPVTPSPVADAGADIDKYPPLIPVNFDASGSYHRDPTRRIILYEWDFSSDGVYDVGSPQPLATHTYPAYDSQGNPTLIPDKIDWAKTSNDYQVRLRVSDDNTPSLSDTDECLIKITSPPWPPVANAGGSYQGTKNCNLILDGSASYDPNGRMYPEPDHPWYGYITSWLWDLDNDGKYDDAQGEKIEWKVPGSGIYPIGIKVANNFGYTDLDNTFVNVENHPPIADANGPYIMTPEGEVILDGSASQDPDGDLLWFTWDFDSDGVYDTPAMLGPISTHTYTLRKQYVATLKVSDGEAYSLSTATVYPLPEILSSVATDKLFYSANEIITIISKAKSAILNIILYDLPLEIEVCHDRLTRRIPILSYQSLWSSKSYWNTAAHTPGDYLVTQTISYGTQSISIATCTFTIVSDTVGISGKIDVTPKEVKTYGSLTFNYTVSNTGNTDLSNLGLNILIIDPDTQELKHIITDVATITKSASYTNTKVWDSVTLKEPKTYLAILQAGTKSLNSDTFKVLPYGFLYGTVTEDTNLPAFSFAIFSDGPQRYCGCQRPFVKEGSVHSNKKATISSRRGLIVELSFINDSPIIGKGKGIPNPEYQGAIPFPKIDLDYYRNKAKDAGRYYTTTKNVQLPNNDGVTMVETDRGTIRFCGNKKGDGTLIIIGADIEFAGCSQFSGLIYVAENPGCGNGGSVKIAGNVKINGQIIAENRVVVCGSSLVYYKPSIIRLPIIPISGASIFVIRNDSIVATQTTSAFGTYTIPDLLIGTCTVLCEAKGYNHKIRDAEIFPQTGTEVNFSLIPSSAIWGKVFYPPPPQYPDPPIPGALVEAFRDSILAGTDTTNCLGRYKIPDLLSGSYTVKASKIGYTERTKEAILLPFRGLKLDFPLIPINSEYAKVYGSITDKNTGEIIEDALVLVYNPQYYLFDYCCCDGYEISSIPAQRYTIVASKEGYCPASRNITLQGGQELNVDLALRPSNKSSSVQEIRDTLEDRNIIAASLIATWQGDYPLYYEPGTPTVLKRNENNQIKLEIFLFGLLGGEIQGSEDISIEDVKTERGNGKTCFVLSEDRDEIELTMKLPEEETRLSLRLWDTLGRIQEVEIEFPQSIPNASELLQSYPNPANNGCYIPFKLSVESNVTVETYNILGQRVKTIEAGPRKAGSYTQKNRAIFWDLTNDYEQKVADGLYFIKFSADDFSATKALVVR